MQRAFCAARAYGKYCSASLLACARRAVSSSTKQRRAIQVAFGIKDQSGERSATIVGSSAETIQDALFAGGGDFENRAEVECAAVSRRPVKVARRIAYQSSPGIGAIGTCERVQNALVTCAVDFEYCPVIVAAHVGGAVEITGAVANERRNWGRPIGSPLEGVDRFLRQRGQSRQRCYTQNRRQHAGTVLAFNPSYSLIQNS